VPNTRRCDIPDCDCTGEFRAPKSRDNLSEYYWFCLDHVRSYNARWDFYAGMSPEEIEAHVRRDTTWARPTWPLGGRHARMRAGDAREYRFHDPFGFFADDEAEAAAGADLRRKRPATAEEQAMAVFDLSFPVTLSDVKVRYKQLVKRHHPDANGGDKAAEERLKLINEAYTTLRNSLSPT
jgi:hypothetical protein